MSSQSVHSKQKPNGMILIIDDQPTNLQMLGTVLRHTNYEIEFASSGKSGLQKIEKRLPDLILLDIRMPEMDGWQVFQTIRVEEGISETPVIILTAKAQSIDKVLGLHIARVNDYVTKPFGPQELLASVKKVLAETEASPS